MLATLIQLITKAKDLLVVAKDPAIAVAAVSGTIVAWRGLSSWRRQLKGNASHSLALRVGQLAGQLSTEIASFRRPFMNASEIATAMSEADLNSQQRLEAKSHIVVYTRRWNQLSAIGQRLQATTFESQILWGENSVATIQALLDCVLDINVSLECMLLDWSDEMPHSIHSESRKKNMAVLSRGHGSDLNDFDARVERATKALVDVARKWATE